MFLSQTLLVIHSRAMALNLNNYKLLASTDPAHTCRAVAVSCTQCLLSNIISQLQSTVVQNAPSTAVREMPTHSAAAHGSCQAEAAAQGQLQNVPLCISASPFM